MEKDKIKVDRARMIKALECYLDLEGQRESKLHDYCNYHLHGTNYKSCKFYTIKEAYYGFLNEIVDNYVNGKELQYDPLERRKGGQRDMGKQMKVNFILTEWHEGDNCISLDSRVNINKEDKMNREAKRFIDMAIKGGLQIRASKKMLAKGEIFIHAKGEKDKRDIIILDNDE